MVGGITERGEGIQRYFWGWGKSMANYDWLKLVCIIRTSYSSSVITCHLFFACEMEIIQSPV